TGGGALDLALPLVFERGGADDEDALDAEVAGHDFGGGQGLDGLAKAHLVADEAAAGTGGEQDRLALVVVKFDPQQVLEGGAADAARKGFGHAPAARFRVAHLGDETENVVVAAQVVLALAGVGEELLEATEPLAEKSAVGAEVALGQPGD